MEGWLAMQFPATVHGYIFEKCIGRGTYSLVYDVTSLKYKQQFCAKVTEIVPEMLDEKGYVVYDTELLCLQQFDHKNVVRLYDFFVVEGCLILILERCCCGTLADLIEDERPLSLQRMRNLFVDTLDGLIFCSEENIAHRDIKPSNILITSYGRAKIGDFGLSQYAQHSEMVDIKCGSMNYAAPEVVSKDWFDPYAADVWSLGVTFFHVAFRRLPFAEDTEMDDRIISRDMFGENADPALVDLIMSMLDREPKNRPKLKEVRQHQFFTKPLTIAVVRRKSAQVKNNGPACQLPMQQLKREIREPFSLKTGSKLLGSGSARATKRNSSFVLKQLTFDTY